MGIEDRTEIGKLLLSRVLGGRVLDISERY